MKNTDCRSWGGIFGETKYLIITVSLNCRSLLYYHSILELQIFVWLWQYTWIADLCLIITVYLNCKSLFITVYLNCKSLFDYHSILKLQIFVCLSQYTWIANLCFLGRNADKWIQTCWIELYRMRTPCSCFWMRNMDMKYDGIWANKQERTATGLGIITTLGRFFLCMELGFHNICIQADHEIRKFDRIIMGKLLKQQQLKVFSFHQACQRNSALVELVKQIATTHSTQTYSPHYRQIREPTSDTTLTSGNNTNSYKDTRICI
jgi:hypothetical protein